MNPTNLSLTQTLTPQCRVGMYGQMTGQSREYMLPPLGSIKREETSNEMCG